MKKNFIPALNLETDSNSDLLDGFLTSGFALSATTGFSDELSPARRKISWAYKDNIEMHD